MRRIVFFNYIHNYPDSNPNFTNVVISAALLHSVLESFITYEMYNDLVEKYQKNILSKDTYDEFEDIFDLNPDLIKNMNYCDPPFIVINIYNEIIRCAHICYNLKDAEYGILHQTGISYLQHRSREYIFMIMYDYISMLDGLKSFTQENGMLYNFYHLVVKFFY